MKNLLERIPEFYSEKLPFVVYRKPNKIAVTGFFMSDNSLDYTTNFNENGFVFAPFLSEEKAILFSIKKALFVSENIDLYEDFTKNDSFIVNKSSKEKHLQIVEKAIKQIQLGAFEKVVISREEIIKISNLDLLKIYKKLLLTYKNAFVYVWFHPKVGLWFGATPETLLEIKNNSFKTMSLAGTQVCHGSEEVSWKTKELEEQQLVTDFIENQLENIGKSLQITNAETVKAGSLLHLRTKVSGQLNDNSNLEELIRALHPTPAVCGLPRNEACNFILKNENYKRSFYTGFLGELNIQKSKDDLKSSHLFVNLRCMKIENNKASIFVGGGITKDSIAEKEWEETVSKSKTMKQVL